MMLFLLIMQIDFLLQNNIILFHLELLNEWFVLYDWSSVLKFRQGIYSFFNIQRVKSNFCLTRIFFLFEFYLFTNALIFCILANFLYFFLIYYNCCSVKNAFIIKTDRIYFCLLSNIENLFRFITFNIHFITFVIKTLGQSNIKSLSFLNFYKPVWHLERSESKSSWRTWSI